MKTFFESMKKFRVLWILVLAFVAMLYIANESRISRAEIIYPQSLDMIVASVEGVDITLRDFAVYVAHQERAVQDQALAYDEDDTRKYWNVRTDMGFVNQVARNEAMSMAIHDALFYQLSLNFDITFTDEEMQILENDVDDFWNDLVDEEKEKRLGITRQDVYNTMYKIACAQKCQMIYAKMHSVSYEDMDFYEEVFLSFLEDYKYEVDDSVLSRIDFGDVTLVHE